MGESVLDKIDNHISYDNSSLDAMNIKGFINQSLKVSAYRGAPYIFKKNFGYTSSSVNEASMAPIPGKTVLFDDVRFYEDIKTQGVTSNKDLKNTFRFYHLFGTHPGASINAEGKLEPGVSQVEATKGCLRLVEEYINDMKQHGNIHSLRHSNDFLNGAYILKKLIALINSFKF